MNSPRAHNAQPSSPLVGRPVTPATIADLWEDLAWPKLLDASRIALRPSRIGLAIFCILGALLIIALADEVDGVREVNVLAGYVRDDLPRNIGTISSGVMDMHAGRVKIGVFRAFISEPVNVLASAPWMTVFLVPVLLTWAAIFGGAIARMAACDIATGPRTTWPSSMAFAISKWRSLLGALVVPLLLIWMGCLAMAVAGWALFNLPGLNVIGGAAWGLFLLGGVVVTVIALAYVLGQAMLVPAIACEGADAVDAIQHAYAFVFARPVRLLAYIAILVVQGMILLAIADLLRQLVVDISLRSASNWVGQTAANGMLRTGSFASISSPPTLGTTQKWTKWAVEMWMHLPGLIVAGLALSYYWSAATLLYLVMRRVVDQQDHREIWMPGMIEGTLAPTSPPPATTPVGASPVAVAAEGVIDNGPADEG